MPITQQKFRATYGKKFAKFLETDIGISFLQVLEMESGSRNVSATLGDAPQAIAFTEQSRAYSRLTKLISSLADESISQQEEPLEFAPAGALDRPTKTKKK